MFRDEMKGVACEILDARACGEGLSRRTWGVRSRVEDLIVSFRSPSKPVHCCMYFLGKPKPRVRLVLNNLCLRV